MNFLATLSIFLLVAVLASVGWYLSDESLSPGEESSLRKLALASSLTLLLATWLIIGCCVTVSRFLLGCQQLIGLLI